MYDPHDTIVKVVAIIAAILGGLLGFLVYGDLLSTIVLAVGVGATTTGVILVIFSFLRS